MVAGAAVGAGADVVAAGGAIVSDGDPIVDVVVPVYNAPDDVRACVDSVLRYTHGGYELVLIDDASPDPRIRELFAEIARTAARGAARQRTQPRLHRHGEPGDGAHAA
jgi:hypothetical protein